jgi:nicotinamidase-related amidase
MNEQRVGVEPYVTEANLSDKTAFWLDAIKEANTHPMLLNVETSAMLVIDMQKFFLDPASPSFTCGGVAVVQNIRKLIGAFRAAGRPVIYTRHVHDPNLTDAGIMREWWEGMCLEGSPQADVHDSLRPLAGEKIVFKHRYSAFYNSDLETVLRVLKIEDLVITGIMTNMCCESTARDAYYRDHRVFFPADGTGSVSEAMHLASLLNLAFGFAYVTTADEIIARVNSRRHHERDIESPQPTSHHNQGEVP